MVVSALCAAGKVLESNEVDSTINPFATMLENTVTAIASNPAGILSMSELFFILVGMLNFTLSRVIAVAAWMSSKVKPIGLRLLIPKLIRSPIRYIVAVRSQIPAESKSSRLDFFSIFIVGLVRFETFLMFVEVM